MKCVDRISFPLFPTEEQKQLMIRNCHNARFAYNWGVAKVLECLDRHELPPSRYTLASEFNRFKHTPGYEWLTNNHASQRATKYAIVKQLDNAMQKYLKEHRRPPTFKSKKSGARMSYYTHEETIKFTPGFVKLEGLGMVKCYHDITDLSNIKITEPVVIFDGDNFTVSIGIKYKTPIKQKYHYSDVDIHSQPIGIDIGIRHLAVTSNGDVSISFKRKLSETGFMKANALTEERLMKSDLLPLRLAFFQEFMVQEFLPVVRLRFLQ